MSKPYRLNPQPDIKLDDMPVCINKWSDVATKNVPHKLEFKGWYSWYPDKEHQQQTCFALFTCSCGRTNYVNQQPSHNKEAGL